MGKFDYDKAEADLFDTGDRYSEEIYSYRDERHRDDYLREHGLDPKKYYQPDSSSSGSSSGGCFLTTACVQAKGLPDDCDELNTLRRFRDSYLTAREDGKKDVALYYKSAPVIVEKINGRPDSAEIWERLYIELVCPCVDLIKNGEFEKAYEHYKNTTEMLWKTYLI